jgi:hypothetical protein
MAKGTKYREQFAQLRPVTAKNVSDNAENRIINMVQRVLKAFEEKQEELYSLGAGIFAGWIGSVVDAVTAFTQTLSTATKARHHAGRQHAADRRASEGGADNNASSCGGWRS